MRSGRRAARHLALLAAIAAAACGRASERAPAADTVAADTVAADTAPFYARTRALDLNADGRADSAVLVARGPRPDSLVVVLTLFVDGREAYREEWRSDYELVDVADSVRVRPRLDAYVRERFDETLAGIELAPLDTVEARLMGDDPRILASLSPRPAMQLVFSYGYETSVVLAWDASRRRLVRLWSCC